jgi:uncharacterized protein YxjI
VQYSIREKGSLLTRELLIEAPHRTLKFRVHGPVVRARDELHIDDAEGVQQALVKEPLLGDGRTYEIHRGGAIAAQVTRIGVGNLLEGFDIITAAGPTLHARGDMLKHEFTVTGASGVAAARARRASRHATEVETEEGQDDLLLLAAVIAIGAMTDIWAKPRPKATRASKS